ncbi:MAG: DUF11 domain-containing protein [Chloroflexi bacterium]|nr:MAG: DUF11 domain-containing protein [Chloroflexota bacterium]
MHNALNITGTGVVVANIDSGVDWMHPALQSQYRGYTGSGKLPNHTGNWYDATSEGATYPVDANGHGTHTMGTMVGDGGIGVAPGAQWIAVRAFDSSGTALNSWLHAAFQWVLAPNNNPALAPDIVNNSWGSPLGTSTEFQADVLALQTAGIFAPFSAGNNGPGSGTVGAPASYDNAFAVGATTSDDEIANFSSRGPSPWGRTKPEVSAPGKDIRSTLPGGAYGLASGTSMAAPHVSGLAALVLQASPALRGDPAAVAYAITSTAVALGSPIPNNDFGWGRIDAYNAVMSVASLGTLSGTVTSSGSPLSGAVVQITPRSNPSLHINATTGSNGAYLQGLAPDTYDVTASAFGYTPSTTYGIVITTGSAAVQNFNLSALPTGTLTGLIRETGTGTPLTATVRVDGTPASTTAGSDGRYTLSLPVGVYTVTVIAPRHRISSVTSITINDGATVTQDFWLDPAPGILVVDSGRWYQESQLDYYTQALDDLRYPYDIWQITSPFVAPTDVPTTTDLLPYDLVIWSSPLDSPGYVGAGPALEGYLAAGGRLLLSGQDIAYYDGGGWFGTEAYLSDYLKATFVEDSAGVLTTTAVAGEPFDGLSLTISGGDGADNQTSPDVIANTDDDFAGPLLTYGSDNLSALHVGLCTPYRAMFLAFGFEAINSRPDRQTVMDRAITWLMSDPPAAGVELLPETGTLVGGFGTVVSHTVRVRNTGASTDTINLTASGVWPFTPLPPSLTLAACQSQTITTGVTISTTTWHISDTLTITGTSTLSPSLVDTAVRVSKSPAPVLLVDDDRWYSFAAEFRQALEANGIPYDYWLVPKSWSGPVPDSPPVDTLTLYPMVVWYTGYDWLQPLTTEEENRLAQYLDGGGRLMFSGQDYIYNLPGHQPSPFATNYLGVLQHTEDFSSTTVTGEPGNPVGDHLGPYTLTFPPGYTNWTDALTPTTTARVASRGQAGQPNALTNAGTGPGGAAWHTHFLAFGPELLSDSARARWMQRSLGWLSWLGQSTVTPDQATAVDGATVVFTATLVNDGPQLLPTVTFTATQPAELAWSTYSTDLSPVGSSLVWSGSLAAGGQKVLTYSAVISAGLPVGTEVNQVSWLSYPEHRILFDRLATVRVNSADLSASSLNVSPATVAVGDRLTYTLSLRNTGVADAPLVTATATLPHNLALENVGTPSRGSVVVGSQGFTWTTPLSVGEAATLTYRAVVSYRSSGAIVHTATADDGFNPLTWLQATATYKDRSVYLPLIVK